MRSYVLAAAALWAILFGQAHAQSPMLPGFPPGTFQNRAALDAAGGGAAPFDLDGTPVLNNTGSGTTVTLTNFSTTYANDIVYVAVVTNGGPLNTPTASGVTFTPRATINSAGTILSLYSGVAASPLSSVTVTATQTGSSFLSAQVFAFSGAKSSAPYDGNAAIPNTGSSCSLTTSNPDDILIVVGVTNFSFDAPFVTIAGAGSGFFDTSAYQIVTATQSANFPSINGGSFGYQSICDAIVKGP